MLYIKHRVNKTDSLQSVERAWGVEIDLRSDLGHPGRLHLSHDPWQAGDDFEEWLAEFCRCGIAGPIILNTKEDGLEARIVELLQRYGVKAFFFLDTQLPTLVKRVIEHGEAFYALRQSVYEAPELLAPFIGRAEWLWVDCFHGQPLAAERLVNLRHHFKICLVSPELQGKPVATLTQFLALQALADAVCTKEPGRWLSAEAGKVS